MVRKSLGETGIDGSGAEGATAPETLRQKDHDASLWKVTRQAYADGITLSGAKTEGAIYHCDSCLAVAGVASVTAQPSNVNVQSLRRLPLHDLHVERQARLAPFAGFLMPLQYSRGILAEHCHVRAAAGLFDVSHMGQILLTPRLGGYAEMARALESLLPLDIVSLPRNRQRYGLLTNDAGGILDDLMVANLECSLYLVVNANSAAADLRYLETHMSTHCDVRLMADRALLALQGPQAVGALSQLIPAVVAMDFMEAGIYSVFGVECFITRSGYTGEDGFEISVPATSARALADRLLQEPGVQLVGLGARDSLRLEAGLCLYGHDLTLETTPVEAGLAWAISSTRRAGRQRSGGFPGAAVVLSQLQLGPAQMRVGLVGSGRPVREGALLFADQESTKCIGRVTSGTYSPTLKKPIAFGYVPSENATPGCVLFAEVRGDRLPLEVTKLPFVPHRYRRTSVNAT